MMLLTDLALRSSVILAIGLLVNGVLGAVHLEEWSRPWLGMESTAMIAVVLATVWHGVGIWMILSGLPKKGGHHAAR